MCISVSYCKDNYLNCCSFLL